jgi:hypothetical protein
LRDVTDARVDGTRDFGGTRYGFCSV